MTIKWHEFLTDTTFDAAGNIVPGLQSVDEFVVDAVVRILKADDVLSTIFPGDKIEAIEFRNPLDYRTMPRLQVYSGSLTPEVLATGATIKQNVTVLIDIRYDLKETPPRGEGRAGISGIVHRIQTVLLADHTLQTQVAVVSAIPREEGLANNSNPGSNNAFIDIDERERRVTATRQLVWVYEMMVDRRSGLPWNIDPVHVNA